MFIPHLLLFSDGSVDIPTRVGCGAYLAVNDIDAPHAFLASVIKTQLFMDTSSTRLELQTLLWALSEVPPAHRLTVFTDCQNIIDLPARRQRLESQQFCSKKGRPLNNGDLYRAFFEIMDGRFYELVKLKGHSRSCEKTPLDRVFALVDQAARQGCRENALGA